MGFRPDGRITWGNILTMLMIVGALIVFTFGPETKAGQNATRALERVGAVEKKNERQDQRIKDLEDAFSSLDKGQALNGQKLDDMDKKLDKIADKLGVIP